MDKIVYKCAGTCGGASDTPGTCQAENCTHHNKPLVKYVQCDDCAKKGKGTEKSKDCDCCKAA